MGPPQVVQDSHTGFCVLTIDERGEIADEITVYGAAQDVTIPRDERSEKNGLVISNVNTLRNPRVFEQTTELLEQLDPRQGVFAFRLSGAHDLLASTEVARNVLDSLPVNPDIVFGNAAEAENLLKHDDLEQATHQILPDSRVLILTRGALETIIRFEGDVHRVPTVPIGEVRDVTGAGDHLMGVTLGELMQTAPRLWTPERVKRAVSIGTTAASQIVQIVDSRLSRETLTQMKESLGRI